MDREVFAEALEREGYAELVTVERAPNGELAEHTHPFEAKALILDGEMRIGAGGKQRLYRPGDVFHLKAGEPHTESYGPEGVRYLVGRKG